MRCLRSALEQEARDLSQQVATLLHEVQQLGAGGAQGQGAVLAIDALPAGEVDADAVVSSRLVAFHNIQVLARCRQVGPTGLCALLLCMGCCLLESFAVNRK